jgi:hypothetical protein
MSKARTSPELEVKSFRRLLHFSEDLTEHSARVISRAKPTKVTVESV